MSPNTLWTHRTLSKVHLIAKPDKTPIFWSWMLFEHYCSPFDAQYSKLWIDIELASSNEAIDTSLSHITAQGLPYYLKTELVCNLVPSKLVAIKAVLYKEQLHAVQISFR